MSVAPENPTPEGPLPRAREILKGLGFGEEEREALAMVAALLENDSYDAAAIHPERVPEVWFFRIEELWRTPPGFRGPVFERQLRITNDARYHKTFANAVRAAQAAFR